MTDDPSTSTTPPGALPPGTGGGGGRGPAGAATTTYRMIDAVTPGTTSAVRHDVLAALEQLKEALAQAMAGPPVALVLRDERALMTLSSLLADGRGALASVAGIRLYAERRPGVFAYAFPVEGAGGGMHGSGGETTAKNADVGMPIYNAPGGSGGGTTWPRPETTLTVWLPPTAPPPHHTRPWALPGCKHQFCPDPVLCDRHGCQRRSSKPAEGG